MNILAGMVQPKKPTLEAEIPKEMLDFYKARATEGDLTGHRRNFLLDKENPEIYNLDYFSETLDLHK